MNVSINPTYYCNFRCDFCYLTPQQLADRQLLSLKILEDRLTEILSTTTIEQVDIYGGEIALMPESYWQEMRAMLLAFGITDINLITNLSAVNSIILDPHCYITVSYDFDAREDSERVWRNMLLLDRPFSVLMLAGPRLIKKSVNEMVRMFNLLNNLQSVEIKPYSANQANELPVSFRDFEEFVKQWIENGDKKFTLVNEHLLDSVLDRTRSSYSDDHVYITPSGKYGVLEFDLNDREFFLEYDTIEEYFAWCQRERTRTQRNRFCGECQYNGHCLSEHLREVRSLENSCNGFKHLIDWYARLEN